MPEENSIWSEALAEAYATAPADSVVLHTIEILHPDFRDSNDNPVSVRVVRNHENPQRWLDRFGPAGQVAIDALGDGAAKERVALISRLEESAPLNGGELVAWVGFAFDIEFPRIQAGAVPEAVLTMDGVGREIADKMADAATSQAETTLIYRPFLVSNLEAPDMDPPYQFILKNIHVPVYRVQARVQMRNPAQKVFPRRLYALEKFPSLSQ